MLFFFKEKLNAFAAECVLWRYWKLKQFLYRVEQKERLFLDVESSCGRCHVFVHDSFVQNNESIVAVVISMSRDISLFYTS